MRPLLPPDLWADKIAEIMGILDTPTLSGEVIALLAVSGCTATWAGVDWRVYSRTGDRLMFVPHNWTFEKWLEVVDSLHREVPKPGHIKLDTINII